MNNIDFNNWKEFKISDIFITNYIGNKLQVPTGASVKKKNLIEGDIPRITVTGLNNGVFGYYQENKEDVNYRVYENFISVSFLGTVFYQSGKASLDMKVHCLKPLTVELNRYTGLFLVNTIYAGLRNSSYADQISSTVLPNLSIRLPINSNGLPDWDYMETYMKTIEMESNEKLSELQVVKNCSNLKVNTTNWSEFKVGDLFEIKKPQVYHTRQVNENEHGIPYVVRSKYNNGMKYRANIKVNEKCKETNPAKVISFGSENASFFYQEEEWISGRDMYYIDTSIYSSYVCFFLISCLETLTSKYNYSFGLFPDLLREEKIKLPVDHNGEPDWQYMDDYMKKTEYNVKNIFNMLNE